VALLAPLDALSAPRARELAAERLPLRAARRARITYRVGQPRFVASRLQDFFGLAAGPTVARGHGCATATAQVLRLGAARTVIEPDAAARLN
jgi:hypothetical protein